jgi:hypothetical protein
MQLLEILHPNVAVPSIPNGNLVKKLWSGGSLKNPAVLEHSAK